MACPRVLAVAAATLAGCAVPPPGAPALSEPQKDAVLWAAQTVLASGSCPGATAELADAPVRLDDPRLPGGALRQPVRVEGCGHRGLLNMLVVPARDGAAAGVTPLLPGTTAADPLLQREGLRLAIMAARAAAPDCDRIAVNDTRAGDAATGAARPWSEIWTLSACGRAFAVRVRFAPGRDATEIAVDPVAIRPPA
jgi:hypothetical protein